MSFCDNLSIEQELPIKYAKNDKGVIITYNKHMNNIIKHSRELRKNMTPQESKLWKFLRKRQIENLRFRRQFPIGNYIVDFICREKKLILEIDGGQHNEIDNIEYDNIRTNYLESLGYTVLRIWNNDIDNNIEGVYEYILSSIKEKECL